MEAATAPSPAAPDAHHDHPAHLAHHFENPTQQFDAGVLGMWLFLGTEILLFAGLFCVYAIYRGLHPEVFLRVDEYLDRNLGAINTVVLLCSSYTMAMAVWAAQRSKRTLLVMFLALTLLGGFGFLGIKYIEYSHKWHEHLLWGKWFQPPDHGEADAHAAAPATQGAPTAPGSPVPAPDATRAVSEIAAVPALEEGWQYQPGASGPRGLLLGAIPDKHHGPAGEIPHEEEITAQFFGIYFAMTGLHGVHVIAGMAVIAWLLWRSARGHFSAEYYTPVPLGGLYWHLVDLIWIFLFPLLYLIH